MEEKHVGIDFLFLLYAELGQLGFLVPRIAYFQLGMVRVKDVLVEEPVERLAGDFLDNRAQILGDDVAVFVAFKVGLHRFTEQLRAEL